MVFSSRFKGFFIFSSLLFFILVGTILRVHQLDFQSLRSDELLSWELTQYTDLYGVVDPYNKLFHSHPPGFEVIIYVTRIFLGDSEIALRLPSAVAGVLSIYLIFLVGKNLFGVYEGLIAAGFMSFARFTIFYSQDVRPYSLLLFFSLMASYFWIKLIKDYGDDSGLKINNSIPYILSAVATSYLSYFGLYFIFFQGVCLFIIFFKRRPHFFTVYKIYSVIALSFSLWFPVFLFQMGNMGESEHWIPQHTVHSFYEILRQFFNFQDVLLNSLFLILALSLFYRIHLIRKTNGKFNLSLLNPDLLVFSWLLIPYLGLLFFSVFIKPLLLPYLLIYIIPAAFLIVARSITQLPSHNGFKIILSSTLLIFLVSSLFYGLYFSNVTKSQFREVASYVVENDLGDSTVIACTYGPEEHNLLQGKFNYYFERFNSTLRSSLVVCGFGDIQNITGHINSGESDFFWFISAEKEPEPELVKYLDETYLLINHREFYRGTAKKYGKKIR